MLTIINGFIEPLGLSPALAGALTFLCAGVVVIGAAMLAYFVMRWGVVGTTLKLISRSESKRDDVFKQMKVFSRLSHLAPGAVIYLLGPTMFEPVPMLAEAVRVLSLVYVTVMVVLLLDALLSAGLAIYRTYPISKTFPITSFVQMRSPYFQ